MQNKTTVVNVRKADYDVFIGRMRGFFAQWAPLGQKFDFGNPWRVGPDCSREEAIRKYRNYFYQRIETDPVFKKEVEALAGKRLGCFCKPQDCHGDVIAQWLNEKQGEESE